MHREVEILAMGCSLSNTDFKSSKNPWTYWIFRIFRIFSDFKFFSDFWGFFRILFYFFSAFSYYFVFEFFRIFCIISDFYFFSDFFGFFRIFFWVYEEFFEWTTPRILVFDESKLNRVERVALWWSSRTIASTFSALHHTATSAATDTPEFTLVWLNTWTGSPANWNRQTSAMSLLFLKK